MRKSIKIFYLAIFIVVLFSNSNAQEPLLKKYKQHFKKDYFSIGTLMQFVFDYQNERVLSGNNGFSVANIRLKINGKFDGGFGYLFQTNFAATPAILDAFMYYKFSPELRVRMGQFKSPFSAEYLIGSPNIDFVNRSRVVTALAPNRQIGFQIYGVIADKIFKYKVGVFNGNSISNNSNDNGEFLYAGRIAFFPKLFDFQNKLEIGINTAFSNDSSASIVGGLLPAYSGKRMLIGTDFRFQSEKLLLSGEYIQAKLEPSAGSKNAPKGFHATAGYMIDPKIQLLLRWDQFDLDNLAVQNEKSDWLVWGVNFWPTSVTELQLNYTINLDESDIKQHQILVNAQIVF